MTPPNATTRRRILVVDDDPTIRRLLALVLRDAGYDTEDVVSAEEAVERSSSSPFDLVLVDKNLPGMSGLQAIAAIRKKSPATLALVITAYPSLESLEEARACGAIGYLVKPFDDLKRIPDLVRIALSDGGKSATLER